MRKLFVLVLLIAFIMPMFADDAKVMPKGVLRTTLAYSYAYIDEAYDTDSEAQPMAEITSHVFSAALEMGITDQITAAVQWAPGYIFASEHATYPKGNVNGANELFIGAKTQILGNQGFIKNDMMRLSLALGAVVPLSNYDGVEEYAKVVAGDDFTLKATGNEAFGIGARLYYDFLITPDFYINLYGQYIKYFESEISMLSPAGTTVKYDYKYSLDFEIEPNYTFKFNEGNKLSVSVPFKYSYTPDYDAGGTTMDDSDTSSFSIAPSVSFFTTALVLPLDLKVEYSIPLAGEDSAAKQTLSVLLKFYTRFYK